MAFAIKKAISTGLCISAIILCANRANAMQVMEFRAETLLLNTSQLAANLNLNPNQQILWQKTEAKLQGIMHQRAIRREHLQSELETAMGGSAIELRDLNSKIEQEEQISMQENKNIREISLTLNDALDDQQRSVLQAFLLEQLLARPDVKKDAAASGNNSHPRKSGSGRSRGGMGGTGATTQF